MFLMKIAKREEKLLILVWPEHNLNHILSFLKNLKLIAKFVKNPMDKMLKWFVYLWMCVNLKYGLLKEDMNLDIKGL